MTTLDVTTPLGPESGAIEALSELRKTRLARRLGNMSVADAAYRVYVTALLSVLAILIVSGRVGDARLDAEAMGQFVADVPAWAGLVVAVALFFGIRSGERGGPLAVEAPDVQHVLLAPLQRRRALRSQTTRLLGRFAMWGAVIGALAGDLAVHRVPGSAPPWVLVAVLFGATTGLLVAAVALLVAGLRLPRLVTTGVAAVVLAWAVADVSGRFATSPTTVLGRILVWPSDFDPLALIPVAVAVLLALLATRAIGGLSIEWARRRTDLIGQLRFAVTRQDLRTVVLLRRQLAAEVPRKRPWFPHLRGRPAVRFPVFARDVASFARWPLVRVVRVLVFGVIAGVALRAAWSGTTPLILGAGVVMYVAALDAIEPLAQEVDHPQLLSSYPWPRGVTLFRHLPGPAAVMVIAAAAAVGATQLGGVDIELLEVAAVALVPAALAATGGAALSITGEPLLDIGNEALGPPEIAGPQALFRAAWPPAVATLGFVPILVARSVAGDGEPLTAAVNAAAVVLVVVILVFAWVRYRQDIRESMENAVAGGAR